MDENINTINKKTGILLTRNTPVALVVGAAGFLGSHLTDKLLMMGIQVVGVDNLSTGRKENLEEAVKNKSFHLILGEAQNLDLDLPRLDYIFLVTEAGWEVTAVLSLFKQKKCRCLLVSSVDLYDEAKKGEDLEWFRKTEAKLAKMAKEDNLNARVLRLGPVFGPRMHFRNGDPTTRLIQAALTADLQKEQPLDFSTRALYVGDGCDLAIKCMLAGSTAQKIFDGILPDPVKVSEIKQILLDPIWYDERGFTPTELPPWSTPNFLKTQKFLNWKPKTNLVEALRQTLSYFKDREIKVPRLEDGEWRMENGKEKSEWKIEKKEQLAAIRPKPEVPKPPQKGIKLPKILLQAVFLFMAAVIIAYGLFWPMIKLSWGVLTFRYQLSLAEESLGKGEFDKSLLAIAQANAGFMEAKAIYQSLQPLRKLNILKSQFEVFDNLSDLASLSVLGARSTALGTEALYLALLAVTGESNEDPFIKFSSAKVELVFADEQISKALSLLADEQFLKRVPPVVKLRVESLEKRLLSYGDLVKNGRAISFLLPEVLRKDGSYLVLLQNNMELRPTGGLIGAYAIFNFEGGKLKKLEVNDIYSIDGQLPIHVEPPQEIKEDLGQKDWFLRDANWEPDFPTSAKQAEWFFTKETGERVLGVLALDVSAISDLLAVLGPLQLSDYRESVNSDNLFEKAITYAGKKDFLSSIALQLFNKIFFLPNQNWPGIVSSLGRSLAEKHLSIFLDDPKLFSYLLAQNWAGTLPRASAKQDLFQDFLAPVEANLGANKANYYLDRSYNLQTVIGKEGEINHRLKISYLNGSPSDAFPAGSYKNRMRLYLPFGSKLIRALWGETEITKDLSSFVDYGRTGYSMLLQVKPKEEISLILDYQVPLKLQFKDGKTIYRLDIVKQAGTLKDTFEWKLTFPINYKLESQLGKIAPQEQIIQTDLSRDRSFEVVFKK